MTKQVVTIRRKALAASEEQAAKLRDRFAGSGTLVLNLISSPGSGKTTLLETTVGRLSDAYKIAVIEGDVATERDADRIRQTSPYQGFAWPWLPESMLSQPRYSNGQQEVLDGLPAGSGKGFRSRRSSHDRANPPDGRWELVCHPAETTASR